MRIGIGCALVATCFLPLLSLACGGGGAESNGAKSAPPPSMETSADSGVSTDAEPSTTTTALADGGNPQERKLAPVGAAASASASASPAKGPHAREPGRGADDIRAIIMARRDEARACYDAAIQDHPGMEGDLVIAWTIDPKGNVTETSVDRTRSQIVDAGVVSCVSDVVKKVQFAPSPGGYETKAFYPFNFHPHHRGADRVQ